MSSKQSKLSKSSSKPTKSSRTSKSSSSKATKRKRVVLTIKQKAQIVDLIEKCVSYTVIAEKYGIGRSMHCGRYKEKQREDTEVQE